MRSSSSGCSEVSHPALDKLKKLLHNLASLLPRWQREVGDAEAARMFRFTGGAGSSGTALAVPAGAGGMFKSQRGNHVL